MEMSISRWPISLFNRNVKIDSDPLVPRSTLPSPVNARIDPTSPLDTVHSATVANLPSKRIEFGNNLHANGRRLSDCLEKQAERAGRYIINSIGLNETELLGRWLILIRDPGEARVSGSDR